MPCPPDRTRTSRTTPTAASGSPPLPSAVAYERLLTEILAVPDDELAGLDLDVTAAITSVARLLSTLRQLGPTLDAVWLRLELGPIDRLECCTLALHHAESRFRRAPKDNLCRLIRQRAVTLFLRTYDEFRAAVHDLLDAEPATLTLVSAGGPHRAVA